MFVVAVVFHGVQDMNGSGKISWTEVRVSSSPTPFPFLADMLTLICIVPHQFLAATIETKGHISEEAFCSAFEHLDFDKNGCISTSVRP